MYKNLDSFDVAWHREAWLAERRKGIGGSDAAASVGLSPWTTMYELWEDKLGRTVDEQTEPMRWGTKLEPLIREEYEHVTGNKVFQPGMIWSDRYSWAFVNLDGMISDELLLECKSARDASGWGEPGTDEIPDSYALQCHHAMACVPEAKRVDVAVLFPYNRFEIYYIDRDEEIIDDLMAGENRFWTFVESKTPPELQTFSDVQKRWKHSRIGDHVTADEALAKAMAEAKRLKKEIKALETAFDQYKFEVCNALGEADTLVDAHGNRLATWRETKPSSRLDTKKLQRLHPDIYRECMGEPQTQRRFLVK